MLVLFTGWNYSPCFAQTALNLAPDQTPEDSSASASLADGVAREAVDKEIEGLTRKIVNLEQELIRLNTNFRIECTGVDKWKRWRLFIYNLGGSGTCLAGSASIAASRWHYWHRSSPMPIPTAVAGPTCLLIGHCVVLAGVLTETAVDLVHDGKVRQKGFDLRTSHKRVLEIKSAVDKLLIERDSCVARLPSAAGTSVITAEIARAEGAVLKDLEALALSEYAQFYARAHNFFAARNANTILALTAASSGGFGGSLPGIISAAQRRPRVVAAGGVGFPISGAIITASPITVKLASERAGKNAIKQIISELEVAAVPSASRFDDDRTRLESLIAQAQPEPPQTEVEQKGSPQKGSSQTEGTQRESPQRGELANIARRLQAYRRHSRLFAAQEQLNAREKVLADRELVERMIFATGVGGTKISWGVNLANAGFGFHRKSVLQLAQGAAAPRLTASSTPGKLFTKRVAIGATTYLPGTSLWLIDTLQNRIRGELRERELVRQNLHPSIVLKERLDLVREIDDAFNY